MKQEVEAQQLRARIAALEQQLDVAGKTNLQVQQQADEAKSWNFDAVLKEKIFPFIFMHRRFDGSAECGSSKQSSARLATKGIWRVQAARSEDPAGTVRHLILTFQLTELALRCRQTKEKIISDFRQSSSNGAPAEVGTDGSSGAIDSLQEQLQEAFATIDQLKAEIQVRCRT